MFQRKVGDLIRLTDNGFQYLKDELMDVIKADMFNPIEGIELLGVNKFEILLIDEKNYKKGNASIRLKEYPTLVFFEDETELLTIKEAR